MPKKSAPIASVNKNVPKSVLANLEAYQQKALRQIATALATPEIQKRRQKQLDELNIARFSAGLAPLTALPPGKWKLYDYAKLYIGNGVHDLDDTTTYRCSLYLSTSNANTLSVGTGIKGDLTNEHATANGYPANGVAVTGNSYTRVGALARFTCNSIVYTASGGSIVARFAVLWRQGTFSGVVNPLLAVCLLDTTPLDVSVTAGNTMTITPDATNGIFENSGATTD